VSPNRDMGGGRHPPLGGCPPCVPMERGTGHLRRCPVSRPPQTPARARCVQTGIAGVAMGWREVLALHAECETLTTESEEIPAKLGALGG
jgi:hypothetical protein